jgi:hypothetical protein
MCSNLTEISQHLLTGTADPFDKDGTLFTSGRAEKFYNISVVRFYFEEYNGLVASQSGRYLLNPGCCRYYHHFFITLHQRESSR